MACLSSLNLTQWFAKAASPELLQWSAASASSFALIAAAEIGDKSQLVCMTLAARYRALPIVLGATVAFALLNLAAVMFGAAAARWLPTYAVDAAVVLLFAGFGLRALLTTEEDEEDETAPKSGHGVFATTFLLIFAAEFGDKTQLAVAGLSAAVPPVPVWVGATLALAMTSALGVIAGRAVLQKIPVHWLHRFSGVLFLGFAAFTAWQTLPEQAVRRLIDLLPPI